MSPFQVVDLEFIQIHFPIQLARPALETGHLRQEEEVPDGVSGGSAAGVGQILGSCSNPGALYNNNDNNNIILYNII
jgi:hypothetical protein